MFTPWTTSALKSCLAGVALASLAGCGAPMRQYSIHGLALDNFRGEAVMFAQVVLFLPDREVETMGDSLGAFSLTTSARPGCYRIRVRRIGYGTGLMNLPLGEATIVDADTVFLAPAIQLEAPILFVKRCVMPVDTVNSGLGVRLIGQLPNTRLELSGAIVR